MKIPKLIAACALPVFCLSACLNNDPYGQQTGGFDEYGGYTGQGEATDTGIYAGDYASEQGDVVSLTGDTGAAAPVSNTYDAYDSSSFDATSYGPGAATYEPTSAPAAPSSYSAPAPSSGRTYIVKKGDNLYRIGRSHQVAMQEIIRLNGLQGTTIYPGQKLILP